MEIAYHDNTGKKVSTKEFIQRWKQGIKNITPMQQLQSVILGSVIVLIGIIWGIAFSVIMKQWWLAVILGGSFIVSFFGFYGNWQKIQLLKKVEAQMKAFEIPQPQGEPSYVQ
jgi:MFS superfamily sulfate permease-like transporter